MNIDEDALQKRMREVMAPRDVRVPEPPLYLREIDEKVYEALRRDAERFRFLRDNLDIVFKLGQLPLHGLNFPGLTNVVDRYMRDKNA